MPVVSYAYVSDVPPIVAVSCVKGGYTANLALKAGSFSLCVLDRARARSVALLGSTSGSLTKDKLADAGLKHRRGAELDVPVIVGSVAILECSLRSKEEVGDHLLLFGEVESATATAAFAGFWDFSKYKPLLYAGWREGLTTYPGPRRRTSGPRRRTSSGPGLSQRPSGG